MPSLPLTASTVPSPFRPRPEHASIELHLIALPTAVACARSFTSGQLRGWRLSELIDTATLITSELVTNAIAAMGGTRTPTSYAELHDMRPATVGIRLRLTRTSLFVEVWDRDPNPPKPAQTIELEETGRGLGLVTVMARAWDFYPSDAVTGGKVVWAEIHIPAHLAACIPPTGISRAPDIQHEATMVRDAPSARPPPRQWPRS